MELSHDAPALSQTEVVALFLLLFPVLHVLSLQFLCPFFSELLVHLALLKGFMHRSFLLWPLPWKYSVNRDRFREWRREINAMVI